MKTSEFLRIVKRDYLARDHFEFKSTTKQRYLCLAIADCGFDLKETLVQELLRNRITLSLDGKSTVESWLETVHKVNTKKLFYYSGIYREYTHTQALFDYRHRWIDELIREYESNGD